MGLHCTWIEFQAVMGVFSLAGTTIFYATSVDGEGSSVIAALVVKNTKLGTTSIEINEAVLETTFLATFPTVEMVKVSGVRP